MPVVDITDRKDLTLFVQNFRSQSKPGSLVLLNGELGAGKTEFVREFLNQLGFEGVSSPTFSLHQRYEVSGKLYHHFDLYRVEKPSELENIGFDEILGSEFEVAFIEWPKGFLDLDPRVFANLKFEVDLKFKRTVNRI